MTNSTISSSEIRRIVDKLSMNRCRDSTKGTYYRIWRIFNRFILRLDAKPSNWEDRIVLFIGYLVDNKLQSSTIKTYLSAIRGVLMDNNITINSDLFLLSSLTRACKIGNDIVVTRLPIHKSLLHAIVKQTDVMFIKQKNQPYLAYLYKAMFMSAYYGLFRIGELTLGPHMILAENVHIGENKNKILFILWTSKMHSRGDKPQLVKISSKPVGGLKQTFSQDRELKTNQCPFKIITNYVQLRPLVKTVNEQVFVFSDNTPVKPNQFSGVLKTLISRLGLDQNLYTVHGIRTGRAGDLLDLGVSVETIKKLGCWRFNAVFTYLRN